MRGHLDLHCPEDGVSLRQYNAPASLESSERKIKNSKRFCIVGVARKLGIVSQRGNHESFKDSVLTAMAQVCRLFLSKMGLLPASSGTLIAQETHLDESEKHDLPLV
jgi:hypothetical protein